MTKKTIKISAESHDNPSYTNGEPVSMNSLDKAGKADNEDTKSNGDDDKKKDEKLVGLGQLFRFATKLDILLMILGTIFAMCHGACLPLLLLVFGDMTDIFIDAAGNIEKLNRTEFESICNFTELGYEWNDIAPPDGDLDDLNRVFKKCGIEDDYNPQTELLEEMEKYALYYVFIAIVVVFAAYGQVAFWLMAAYRQTQRIRLTLFRAIMRQEIGWFDTHDAGELNSRISDDVEKIEKGIGDKLGNFFQWFSTFITGMVIGFTYGWKLSLVILSVSPLLVACGAIFTMLSGLATKGELNAYAKAGAVAQEVLSSVRTVFAFGGQDREAERYKVRLSGAQKYGIKKSLYNGTSYGAVYLIIYLVFALAFWYGAKLVRDEPNNYTGGQVLIVFFGILMGAFALGNAGPNLQHMSTARGAASYIWDLVDRVPAIDSFSDEGIKPNDVVGNISLRDCKFVYPSRQEVQVLNGLSLDVSKGQTAALVGHSGCGKSTVVQLLQRFYDLESGSVMIDGRHVKDYNIKWLRQHIGVVSQEPVLFDTTIKENIMFGRDGVTMDEIIEATRQSNAYDFIQKLPKKYDTLVGERGTQLSGGQKQRIAIARALVRNPKILLLDEATSALDTESEATVQSALDKASQGRTTLVIAHRLSTIKNADVIFGIKDGVVVEQGSHDELMSRGEGGIYYKLVTNQKTMEPAPEGHEDDDIAQVSDNAIVLDGDHKKSPVKRQRTVSVGDHKEEETEEDLPEMSLARVMRLNAPEWLFIVVGCIGALVNGGNQPAMAVIFAEIIGLFAEDRDKQKEEAFFWSMMFIVVGFATFIAMFLQAYMFGISGERLTLRIRDLCFRTLLKQEVAFFDDEKNSTGALCTRLSTDASAIQGATGARIGSICMNVAAIGTGLAIGFYYSWKLSLLLVGFVPIMMFAFGLQMKILQGTAASGRDALVEAGKTVTEVISNMRTVASLTKEIHFYEKFEELTGGPSKKAVFKANVIGVTFGVSQSVIFFAYAAIFYLGAYLVEEENLYFEDMFKVYGAIIFSAMAMGEAGHFAPDYGKAKAAGSRVFALLDREPAIDSSSTEGQKPTTLKGVIHFRDVHFVYPTRPTVQVLQGLSLDVMPGQSVALVGSSGCGKSTTVSLLERFYDSISGQLNVDGVDVRDLNIQWLRSQMAIVQQEPILFDTSIKENIAYGCLHDPTMDEIINAARDANIHEFIANLPDGYETNVGDKGTQMSGGQKQRIAIARALIRNPKILLLDEATSALDTESEKVVQQALDKAQEGRTSIVIAHRLSTIRNSDCIFVFKNGVVHEKGTHDDLMSSKGIYYKLNQAQAKKAASL